MRLLLRANSHRRHPDGSVEIAASPDTPGREPWQWQVRLVDVDVAAGVSTSGQTVRLPPSQGIERLLDVSVDSRTTQAVVEVQEVGSELLVRRTPQELLILLVHRGEALVEHRHLLAESDALVLAGDDPLEVSVDITDQAAGLCVVRLHPTTDRPLAWVP